MADHQTRRHTLRSLLTKKVWIARTVGHQHSGSGTIGDAAVVAPWARFPASFLEPNRPRCVRRWMRWTSIVACSWTFAGEMSIVSSRVRSHELAPMPTTVHRGSIDRLIAIAFRRFGSGVVYKHELRSLPRRIRQVARTFQSNLDTMGVI